MNKGRNKILIEKRDMALLRRYHYWTEVQRLRFDDALRQLSENEFFISEERIMAIIRKNCQKVPSLLITSVPRVKKPKITAGQLVLFTDQELPTSR